MVITIYYINKDWNLIFRFIDIEPFIEIHDAIYSEKILNDILKSFEI